jgi:hypothetical protein
MMRPTTGPLASHRRRPCPNDRHHGFWVPIQGQALRGSLGCGARSLTSGEIAGGCGFSCTTTKP